MRRKIISDLVNDCTFDRLDANRLLIDPQYTGTLARCRAGPTSELREVICQQEPIQRILPLSLENEIIPFWNDVRDRTASVCLAEGDAAVHATR